MSIVFNPLSISQGPAARGSRSGPHTNGQIYTLRVFGKKENHIISLCGSSAKFIIQYSDPWNICETPYSKTALYDHSSSVFRDQ